MFDVINYKEGGLSVEVMNNNLPHNTVPQVCLPV